MGESVVMILSKYILTKVANVTKMNSKCSHTYVDKLLIMCWTVEELERFCNLSRIREIKC